MIRILGKQLRVYIPWCHWSTKLELRCDESWMVRSDILLAVWLLCEVEYAGKAVENSGTTLAICCKVISAFLKLQHVGPKSSWERKWGTEKDHEIFVYFFSILGLSPVRTVWSSQLRNSCGALRWHWNQLTEILDASSAVIDSLQSHRPKSRLKPPGF